MIHVPAIILTHLFVQLAVIHIISGVTIEIVLLQHLPAIIIMIALITVMRVAAHVSHIEIRAPSEDSKRGF